MLYWHKQKIINNKKQYRNGKKPIVRVDGLVAILTLFLLVIELSCIIDLIIAMRG